MRKTKEYQSTEPDVDYGEEGSKHQKARTSKAPKRIIINSMKPPGKQIGDNGNADEENCHLDERIAMPNTIKEYRSGTHRTQADGDQEGLIAS